MKIEAEIRAYLEDLRKKEVELNQLVNNAKTRRDQGKIVPTTHVYSASKRDSGMGARRIFSA